MAKELLVNVSRGEEVRVALVEDGRLEEVYLERDAATSNVGNIYLGKVTNVESSIQAAFVDFGYGRNGFLHVQDLHPDYFPEGGRWDRMTERVGKKIGRRDRPPIQDSLRRNDEIIVQIIKEGIGTKGPTLTSYPSIPGRFLVMMPGVAQMGVSKNIEDEEERRRLRKVLDGLKPPKNVGFIIRTAGMGKTKTELERDFKYLTRLYEQIEHHKKNARPPSLLYSEGDLVTRTIRDVWTSDVERVICDDAETALRIKQFFKLLMPRTKVAVQLYQGHMPLFHAAGIETEIETMFSRHVPLPSGASLVIDSTEAIVAVDVNSGKFRDHADAEETAFRTDMEAAEELCRQLRLRDLGGVVIVDFIDLRYSRHREALFNKLTDLFKRDKAKSRHLPMNEFGIVAITRQRMRPDLKKSVFMPCPWSGGTGFIKTPESMALDVMRRLRVATADERVRQVNVGLFPTVALHVLNTKRQALADLERISGKRIIIRQDEQLAADAVNVELLDERDGQVQIESLRAPEAEDHKENGHPRRRRRRRRRDENGQVEQGRGQEARDEAGLLELPDLLELGELKLEEVEKLVDEVMVRQGARREAVLKDPQKLILEAMRSGALFEDESEEAPAPAEKPAEAAPAAQEQEERGGRRRRRRRGRGGREEGQPAPAAGSPAPAEAVEDEEQEERLEQPVQAQAPAAGATDEADAGSRRRRRRRRGRGGDRQEREGAPAEQRSASSGQRPREPMRQPPAEPVNGDRSRHQPHTQQREAAAGPAQEGQESRGRRRGRRGRRGRGAGVPAAADLSGRAGTAGLTDEQLDARVNGNNIYSGPKKPIALFRETEDDEPVLPAAADSAPAPVGEPDRAGDDPDGGRRRRRRRRRRRGEQREQAPSEAAAATLAEAVDEAAAEILEPVLEEALVPAGEPEAQEEEEAVAPIEQEQPAAPVKKAPARKTAAKRAKATKKTAAKKAPKKAAKAAKSTTRAKSAKKSSKKAV